MNIWVICPFLDLRIVGIWLCNKLKGFDDGRENSVRVACRLEVCVLQINKQKKVKTEQQRPKDLHSFKHKQMSPVSFGMAEGSSKNGCVLFM